MAVPPWVKRVNVPDLGMLKKAPVPQSQPTPVIDKFSLELTQRGAPSPEDLAEPARPRPRAPAIRPAQDFENLPGQGGGADPQAWLRPSNFLGTPPSTNPNFASGVKKGEIAQDVADDHASRRPDLTPSQFTALGGDPKDFAGIQARLATLPRSAGQPVEPPPPAIDISKVARDSTSNMPAFSPSVWGGAALAGASGGLAPLAAGVGALGSPAAALAGAGIGALGGAGGAALTQGIEHAPTGAVLGALTAPALIGGPEAIAGSGVGAADDLTRMGSTFGRATQAGDTLLPPPSLVSEAPALESTMMRAPSALDESTVMRAPTALPESGIASAPPSLVDESAILANQPVVQPGAPTGSVLRPPAPPPASGTVNQRIPGTPPKPPVDFANMPPGQGEFDTLVRPSPLGGNASPDATGRMNLLAGKGLNPIDTGQFPRFGSATGASLPPSSPAAQTVAQRSPFVNPADGAPQGGGILRSLDQSAGRVLRSPGALAASLTAGLGYGAGAGLGGSLLAGSPADAAAQKAIPSASASAPYAKQRSEPEMIEPVDEETVATLKPAIQSAGISQQEYAQAFAEVDGADFNDPAVREKYMIEAAQFFDPIQPAGPLRKQGGFPGLEGAAQGLDRMLRGR